ncbi:3433_t:CDS:2 [Ambispora gerdemannii]|uniref:3433_t:CDS:1 n=1 Tax=Ambispora gerdemannii TaxID=144530 RepID=A0A9N8UZS8_9GLOM|nr:3433_t:CDS:2 [Ambispora gerdemannii]
MALARTFKLNTGVLIPAIGLGVPPVSRAKDRRIPPSSVQYTVQKFLKLGYRHVDTAQFNTNDVPLGQGIRASKVKREDIFLTQKLWNNQHQPELVKKSCEGSLERSRVKYFDLYLMHWPIALKDTRKKASEAIENPDKKSSEAKENPDKKASEAKENPGKKSSEAKENPDKKPPKYRNPVEIDDSIDFVETYLAMEPLVESGKVKAIGVANFGIKRLEKLLEKAKIPPAVNQVEMHPYLPQNDLLEFCKSKNIHVTAYLPFGVASSPLRTDEVIRKIADKNGKTKQQILASWAVQRGTSVITEGTSVKIVEKVFQDFVLPDDDFQEINELSKTKQERYITREDWNFEWD